EDNHDRGDHSTLCHKFMPVKKSGWAWDFPRPLLTRSGGALIRVARLYPRSTIMSVRAKLVSRSIANGAGVTRELFVEPTGTFVTEAVAVYAKHPVGVGTGGAERSLAPLFLAALPIVLGAPCGVFSRTSLGLASRQGHSGQQDQEERGLQSGAGHWLFHWLIGG
ncbi:MAG: hypothetical protein ABMA26_19230, partial [Limisphaerales bacterium]